MGHRKVGFFLTYGIRREIIKSLTPILEFRVRGIVKGKQPNDETTKVIPFKFDGGGYDERYTKTTDREVKSRGIKLRKDI